MAETLGRWTLKRVATRAVPLSILAVMGLFLHNWQPREGVGDAATPSPDFTFVLEVSSAAKYRYDYVERKPSPKNIYVSLQKSGDCLYCRKYPVTGWDVSWHTRWVSQQEAVVEIFDFGPQVDHRDGKARDLKTRAIATLGLQIDEKTGDVKEHWSHTETRSP